MNVSLPEEEPDNAEDSNDEHCDDIWKVSQVQMTLPRSSKRNGNTLQKWVSRGCANLQLVAHPCGAADPSDTTNMTMIKPTVIRAAPGQSTRLSTTCRISVGMKTTAMIATAPPIAAIVHSTARQVYLFISKHSTKLRNIRWDEDCIVFREESRTGDLRRVCGEDPSHDHSKRCTDRGSR